MRIAAAAEDGPEEKPKKSCFCFKSSSPSEDVNGSKNTNFIDKIIIRKDHFMIKILDYIVTALYLVSSYFYGLLAAFRYSDFTDDYAFYMTFMITFESIFLLHMLM
jgi:hypothetical protein